MAKVANTKAAAAKKEFLNDFISPSLRERFIWPVCKVGLRNQAMPQRQVQTQGQVLHDHILPDLLTLEQVLIEEKFHCSGTTMSLHSRSAANTQQARMSSASRYGKSEDLSLSYAGGKIVQHLVNRNPYAPDAWFAAPIAGFMVMRSR
jgi:hypothetical protein